MSARRDYPIHPVGGDPTVRFAAEELRACLVRMGVAEAPMEPAAAYRADLPGIWLGTADAFPGIRMPAVADPKWDDAVRISVKDGTGVVAGSNPRSVLLAAYRLLHEAGCRWVRPGADGAYIPRLAAGGLEAEVCEAASYRHRGMVIEGAVSFEHVRDMIAWMPKVGMNSYFIQFREAYTFFDRWYSRMGHPAGRREGFSVEKAGELRARAAAEIRRRGLLLHAVGHGWTCEPLGIRGLGWEYPAEKAPAEAVHCLAEVDGKRELWGGVPLNTNLCYSNPAVRRLMAEDIARYAAEHPEVDALHIWLADGANNSCECAGCRAARPADFYVRILNEADSLLAERGLPVKLVFLIYVDLLWPPETERFANPDRFLLMFAPITRTYSRTFAPEPGARQKSPLPPFVRNRLQFPKDVAANLAFLDAWRRVFPGDGFDFDYHFMWDHLADPGYTEAARTLHEDVKLLRGMGLNGYLSCQVQRAFLPTGLGETVLGWTLWDASRDYEGMRKDYYAAAFGRDGEAAAAYLAELTGRFDTRWMRGEKPVRDEAVAGSLEGIPETIRSFRPVIERNLSLPDPCHAASWNYLRHHADIAEGIAGVMALRARGQWERMRSAWAALQAEVWKREEVLHPVMDAWLFVHVMGRILDRDAAV